MILPTDKPIEEWTEADREWVATLWKTFALMAEHDRVTMNERWLSALQKAVEEAILANESRDYDLTQSKLALIKWMVRG